MKAQTPTPSTAEPAMVGAPPYPGAATADRPRDALRPARLANLVVPSDDGALNALMYTASGVGPHPTLLLLHGFPGYEQNLDLAHAARRAGWNVLTFHYRGSWGSPGTFSFAHCEQDAANVLAFLRQPGTVARFRIDPTRIAVAGHSMGGLLAARLAAADPGVVGAFLLDPVDLAAISRSLADPNLRESLLADEVRPGLPPLAGTSEEAILEELERLGPTLELSAATSALAGRPIALIGAHWGFGSMATSAAQAARDAGSGRVDAETLPTDHGFSDMRIALSVRLVGWLARLGN